ncbi:MAG: dTDP-glucose 4,6-dehydratase [Firmicutes bacterium]|nr:dTDP-glucose 4,6-dehydratase [Bacillota bacterium]
MNIMITGGYGFIGSNFIRYWKLKHKDDFILNVDVLTYAAVKESLVQLEKEDSKYAFVHADICDYDKIEKAVKDYNIDTIVNFAAESHNSYSIINPTVFYHSNVMGIQNLLEITRKNKTIKRLHHISTCEVYGDLSLDSNDAFTEEYPLRGNSPYNSSKACGNMAVNAYFRTYGIPVTISTCSNNYGAYQFPEKVIPLFATNILQDKPLTLYKESQNRREWLHVTDHCRAIEVILEKGVEGQTYNIGSGVEKSVEDIAVAVLEHFGKSDDCKKYIESRPSHDRRYLLDCTKIKNQLGWEAQVSFDEGISETIEWYANNRKWWENLLDRSPAKENMWDGK